MSHQMKHIVMSMPKKSLFSFGAKIAFACIILPSLNLATNMHKVRIIKIAGFLSA